MKRSNLILSTALAISMLACAPAHAQLNPDMRTFPKWTRVMEAEKPKTPAGPVKSLPKLLDATQAHYRGIPYVDDQDIYGVGDYWATREEMKRERAGDCEDFAIAEYFDLLEAGVPEDQMLISVVWAKQTQEIHAFLRVGDKVLDRRAERVLTADEALNYYTPIFSISRLGWKKD